MVLRYPDTGVPLRDYGILIPVARNRPEQILDALRKDPDLGPESSWLIGPDGSRIEREDIERVHDPEYVARLFGDGLDEVLLSVFELVDESGAHQRYDPAIATQPLSGIFAGTLRGLAGTYQCGREALARGFCFYLGGGAHHGHYRFGHGFCVVNDSVIALRKLQHEQRIRAAWVIDVDAHKGDGTAALTRDDPSITTLSVHMAHGWPLDIPERDATGTPHPSHVPSDIDVPIAAGEESLYVPRLGAALARLASGPRPDVVYVLAGADPYEHDELPSTRGLRLTLDQMLARDLLVFETLRELGIPQAWLMAGGYGERAWEPYPPFLTRAVREAVHGASS
ncbi:MAG: histone deacetylase [Spirochaetota bacterium]